jgi:DNA-binding protein H-NS
MVTLSQLEKQIDKLRQKADALRRKKSTEVIAGIRKLMAEHGLTTADIDSTIPAVPARRRGRPAATTSASLAVKAQRKKVVSGKSKLPPKYLHPETGATWSGHARPPAWIKDAADRSVFLIAAANTTGGAVATKGKPGRKQAQGASSEIAVKKKPGRKPGQKVASVKSAKATPKKRGPKTLSAKRGSATTASSTVAPSA